MLKSSSVSTRGGVEGIYVMDDDGSNETLLTEAETLRPYPNSWSPDGKFILYKSRFDWNSRYVIFLMNPRRNKCSATHRERWEYYR